MKKTTLFFLFSFFVNLSFAHADQEPLPANLKNESTISYNLKEIPGEKGQALCNGTFPSELKNFKIYSNFKFGTICVVGDFDGNGYVDFAFLGPDFKKIAVVFYEKSKVIRTDFMNSKLSSPLSYYAATEKTGPCGEPISSLPGLFQMSTDRYKMWDPTQGQIYFYNPSTQKMQPKYFGKTHLKTCK